MQSHHVWTKDLCTWSERWQQLHWEEQIGWIYQTRVRKCQILFGYLLNRLLPNIDKNPGIPIFLYQHCSGHLTTLFHRSVSFITSQFRLLLKITLFIRPCIDDLVSFLLMINLLFLWLAVKSHIHLLKRQSSKSARVCTPAYIIIMSPFESISA